MNDQSWQLVEHVFNIAIELPPSQRPSYLDSACVDESIRAEVESLIEAEERSKTFFENRIAAAAREAADEREKAKKSKENRIGPYRLIRPLGSGTAGDVYLAERADGAEKTRYAIKVLRAAPSAAPTERAAELRRKLERLRHPHLNPVIDGGESSTGAPYFVMELVEGERLDVYCDRRMLDLEQRIELFREVCFAVHFAHQNLLAHRGLKPANVLVTADGTPRLMDLGLAQLLERDRNGQRSASIYASPEQVRGDALSTASDVYALGVMLFELLSGRLPYDLQSSSAIEIERIVCELPTPFPSTMVQDRRPVRPGTKALETAESVSLKRGTTPEKLERRLRGDLDSIVLKAMDKDPRLRYASAAHLAEDLERYAKGLPVSARSDGWSYRIGKFLTRAWPWTTLAAAALLLLAGTAVRNGVGLSRASAEREAALEGRREARTALGFLTDAFAVADPREARGGAVTAREALDWGVARSRREMRDEPEQQAAVLSALAEAYSRLGLYEFAQATAQEALAKRLATLGENHPSVAASSRQTGELERLMDRHEEAERRFRRALGIDRAAHPVDDAAIADDLDGLARALRDGARYDEAEAAAREAVALRQKTGQQPALAASQRGLGEILYGRRRYEESAAVLREAVDGFRAAHGEAHPETAAALKSLGAVLRDAGRLQEAEEAFGKGLSATLEVYGERHPAAADSLRSLAEALHQRGRVKEAREMLQVALDVDRTSLGADHPEVAADLAAIARIARQQGALAEAESHLRTAVAGRPGQEDPLTASLLVELGSVVTEAGRPQEAEPVLREALRILQATGTAESAQISDARKSLAITLAAQGKSN